MTNNRTHPDVAIYIKDHASLAIIGFDRDHIVEDVLFDNVVLDGKQVGAQDMTMNDFVRDIRFENSKESNAK